jgi:acetylornithine deacetylase/succinyl-diaminopimelate desuccinylase-like protein
MKLKHSLVARAAATALAAVCIAALTSHAGAQPKPAAPARQPTPGTITKAPPPKPIDYAKITDEAVELLSQYIRIDTTNPPGTNEIHAARLLQQKLLADGIPATTWEPAPGRGIIAARLHGVGRNQKAVMLLSHMDVVPAKAKDWEVPPFAGEVRDGKVWGRGALDDKGPGVIFLMAMLAIKRAGILLERDVVFLATGDEEEGGRLGAGWFVEHHPKLYADVEYVLNEGGGIMVRQDGKKLYTVSVTEKTPLWLRLTAYGVAGHAADPPARTAVTKLVQALDKLAAHRAPIRIIDPVAGYYRALAKMNNGPREWLDLATSLKDPAYARNFTQVPSQNASVRDTLTPTVLSGSEKTNVIPMIAHAEVDCRLLPGSDAKAFVRTVRKIIADDSVKVDVVLNFPPASSPSRSELMTAIQTLARKYDKADVVPTMLAGFTDSHYFREKKITSYGFVPLETPQGESRGVHGINERIGIKEMGRAIERTVELLKLIAVQANPA